jgi:hypothetical protein
MPSSSQANPVAFVAENEKPCVASGETLPGLEIHVMAPTKTRGGGSVVVVVEDEVVWVTVLVDPVDVVVESTDPDFVVVDPPEPPVPDPVVVLDPPVVVVSVSVCPKAPPRCTRTAIAAPLARSTMAATAESSNTRPRGRRGRPRPAARFRVATPRL